MTKRYTRADGTEVYEGEYVEVVEGEIVEPDNIDRAFDLARHLELVDQERMKALVRKGLNAQPEPDIGRSIVAALGGAAGASFKSVGAATGAGIGALLYDLVMDSFDPGRTKRRKVDKQIERLRGKK